MGVTQTLRTIITSAHKGASPKKNMIEHEYDEGENATISLWDDSGMLEDLGWFDIDDEFTDMTMDERYDFIVNDLGLRKAIKGKEWYLVTNVTGGEYEVFA